MARSNEPSQGQLPQPPDQQAFRHYGDGTAGKISTARLQGYYSGGLTYVDIATDVNGNLLAALAAGSSIEIGTVDQGAAGASAWLIHGTVTATGSVTVSGSVALTGGTVTATWSTAQPISGTVTASWSSAQPISGSVTVSGSVTPLKVAQTGAVPVSFSATATSTTAVTNNSSRTGLVVTNLSATNSVSLGLGTTALSSSGITLNANGGVWVMDQYTFTTQSVTAIAAAASTLAIQELN